jgi:hypothetical protein
MIYQTINHKRQDRRDAGVSQQVIAYWLGNNTKFCNVSVPDAQSEGGPGTNSHVGNTSVLDVDINFEDMQNGLNGLYG